MDKITQILENVVSCKYFEAGVHIKNPRKNSYQDGLGRTTQTLDYVVVVHILIWDKRKSQITNIVIHILLLFRLKLMKSDDEGCQKPPLQASQVLPPTTRPT